MIMTSKTRIDKTLEFIDAEISKEINGEVKKDQYSLDCSYYNKSFSNVNDLINDIISSGQDPNYEITWNGIPTSEIANDYILL
jgi:hypothetical protein